MEDVTFQAEMKHSGGGIFINVDNWNDQPSTIRLENLVIENNNAMYGGGVFVRRANLEMNNCIIRDNFTYTEENYNRNGMGGALFMMHAQSNLPSKIKNTLMKQIPHMKGEQYYYGKTAGENIK